jgi:hypothetical protein
VAWKIVVAAQPYPWEPEWKALLGHFRRVVPADRTVVVMADRGLYAKWLFEAITAVDWHPLLRINARGKFRPAGWYHRFGLRGWMDRVGQQWRGRGIAFPTPSCQLSRTLLARRAERYAEAWLVVTDLPPEAADVCWYGLGARIERGFKRFKRGGWHWQYTRMDDPARAERLWLALAIAPWWLIAVSGEAEETVAVETMDAAPQTQKRRWRLIGVFHRGWVVIMAALLHHDPLPLATGKPDEWPTETPSTAVNNAPSPARSGNLQL